MRPMPEEIEDPNPAIRPRRAGLRRVRQHPAQSVRGGPGIAHRVPGRGGRGSVERLSVERSNELPTEGEQ